MYRHVFSIPFHLQRIVCSITNPDKAPLEVKRLSQPAKLAQKQLAEVKPITGRRTRSVLYVEKYLAHEVGQVDLNLNFNS